MIRAEQRTVFFVCCDVCNDQSGVFFSWDHLLSVTKREGWVIEPDWQACHKHNSTEKIPDYEERRDTQKKWIDKRYQYPEPRPKPRKPWDALEYTKQMSNLLDRIARLESQGDPGILLPGLRKEFSDCFIKLSEAVNKDPAVR